jgi:AbrB family looped-hinge helix DNA binding protein
MQGGSRKSILSDPEYIPNSQTILMLKIMENYYNYGATMTSETATVTSKSMVNIPAEIRRKYSIREGSKIVFVETDRGVIELIPVPKLSDLFGAGRKNREALLEGIRELHEERRREAALDRKKRRD